MPLLVRRDLMYPNIFLLDVPVIAHWLERVHTKYEVVSYIINIYKYVNIYV